MDKEAFLALDFRSPSGFIELERTSLHFRFFSSLPVVHLFALQPSRRAEYRKCVSVLEGRVIPQDVTFASRISCRAGVSTEDIIAFVKAGSLRMALPKTGTAYTWTTQACFFTCRSTSESPHSVTLAQSTVDTTYSSVAAISSGPGELDGVVPILDVHHARPVTTVKFLGAHRSRTEDLPGGIISRGRARHQHASRCSAWSEGNGTSCQPVTILESEQFEQRVCCFHILSSQCAPQLLKKLKKYIPSNAGASYFAQYQGIY